MTVVAAVTATSALGSSAIVAALPELAARFDVGLAEIGILQTIVALPGVLLNPYVGLLADRVGARRIVVICLGLYAGFGVAGAFAPTFGLLLLSRFLMGAPYAALLVLTPNIVSRMFDGEARRRAIGLNSAALTLSSTVGPVIGAFLALGGAQRAFLVYALGLPMAGLALLVPEDVDRLADDRPTSMRSALAEIRAAGHLGDLVGVFSYMFFFLTIFVGFGFVLTPVHLDGLGIGLEQRGPIMGAANLGSATASLAFAVTPLGAHRGRAVVIAQILAGVGLIGLAVTGTGVGVAVSILLIGLGMGTTYNALQVLISSSTSDRHRGLALGIWSSAARLGQVTGGLLVAALALAVGATTAFLIGAASVAVVALALRPTRRLLAVLLRPADGLDGPPGTGAHGTGVRDAAADVAGDTGPDGSRG